MLNYKLLLFVFVSMAIVSCKKGWIDIKSNKSLDIPSSVEDYQALLDNSAFMNDNRQSLGEISADNYYYPYNIWQTWSSTNKNAYVWTSDIYNNATTDNVNWNYSYRQVFYANLVLDGIDDVSSGKNTPDWSNVKGSALFYRGEAFFNVSQIYTRPYSLTFPDYAGIPLRLSSDLNEVSSRAGLQDTYQRILKDLKGSLDYLPNVPLYKVRPAKPAAYAMLSRVYLVMQDYPNALLYADSCLKLYDSVLDYNTLKTAGVNFPIPALNKEVIFQTTISDDLQSPTPCFVDSSLYRSYDNNDLRKTLFYKTNTSGQANFIGTYTGGTISTASKAFGGIATDEVYLTRAECYARTGNVTLAMGDLNKLMIARWKSTAPFVPFTATNQVDALALILQERRKETPFRGLRWLDLRRLNSQGANITVTRNLNGQIYTLPPNDPKYALPIPPDVVTITGMPQNER